MSDMVGIELSQKRRRLHLFRNESSFARSDAEQRPDHAGRQYVVTTEDSHHVQQTAARRQQVVYVMSLLFALLGVLVGRCRLDVFSSFLLFSTLSTFIIIVLTVS